MRDKGLTPKFRAYEVRSISHSAGGPNLDISPLFGDMFDLLDAWVDKGVVPPPMRSDWEELGDVDDDGGDREPRAERSRGGVSARGLLPDHSTSGSIFFAPFTGTGLEPLDLEQSVRRHEPQRRLGLSGKPDRAPGDVSASCR